MLFGISACVAKKDVILPTKYDREQKVAAYKQCVARATSQGYDDIRNPDEIVRQSMKHCLSSKNWMLKEYPPSWRKGFEKEVDEEIYQQEIAWILKNRQ